MAYFLTAVLLLSPSIVAAQAAIVFPDYALENAIVRYQVDIPLRPLAPSGPSIWRPILPEPPEVPILPGPYIRQKYDPVLNVPKFSPGSEINAAQEAEIARIRDLYLGGK